MTLLVGVDAGASRTTAFVADRSLTLLARAWGAPGALAPGEVAGAADAIRETVRRALGLAGADRAGALVVGAAGAGQEADRAALEAELAGWGMAAAVRVTTDVEIALVAALGDAPGILLLAGTGSGACAQLSSGIRRRTGGHGWQFGDEGSGYALARAAVAAVGRAADGRGPATMLTAALARAAGVGPAAEELLTWARSAPRARVADLAQAAQETAAGGDPVASALIEEAARDLVAHLRALFPLFPGSGPIAVVLAGGLVRETQPVRAEVIRLLAKAWPRCQVSPEAVEPPRGALVLAARLA